MPPEYHSHPEYLALLETVRAYPHDDAPRLILADWIEKHGDDERAEFIRLQIQRVTLARIPFNPLDDTKHGPIYGLLARERELLRYANHVKWIEWREAKYVGWYEGDITRIDFNVGLDEWNYWFIRGFVSEIILPSAAFMTHAATLFAKHPIARVTLTKRHPCRDATFGHYTFFPSDHFEDNPYVIPAIFEPPPSGFRFATREAAFDWLSRRCVDYGRQLAGLPPLRDVTS
ncbi:TIGR02996 domain-containing protein [Zavarzinella formosa]|uniref:TIGR02996 domain-containing protein n=1 Tax=Zavarzinella formosa TaxID=360055 RepID=UPI00037A1D65|nr:TIGR02996 domain-containing protein [Zavarzinella formosa]